MGQAIVDSAKRGAKLIVLPELVTCGYSFLSSTEARPFAEKPDEGRTWLYVKTLCERLGVYVAYGYMEAGPVGTYYNSQALMGPQGLLANYRKANLWGNDFIWATAGTDSPPIVDVEGRKVGLLICRDVRDKSDSMSSLYELGDADLVAFSANFGDGGFPSGTWVRFAKDNGVFLLVSNRYGQEQNNNFGEGGICVISPQGKVHCDGLKWSEPCIVYADI